MAPKRSTPISPSRPSRRLLPEIDEDVTLDEVIARYIKAVNKGILKVMSKMGISTYQSYCGAQIFDAVGLRSDFVAKYFTGTNSQIEGVGLAEIAKETVERHKARLRRCACPAQHALDVGGEYAFRIRGEAHSWRPQVVADLQHAVRGNLPEKYRAYADGHESAGQGAADLARHVPHHGTPTRSANHPIPLDEVEPASEIVKRFATGAMSFGSISREAHTTLAIAMNRIGGKSNTGEGGEEVDRFTPMPNGDSMRSAIKQVASGRFGVTTEYLSNADMIQIKMAQGAKPGEGGQLPGHKVDGTIAKVRHSTPGVGLISPPPHHDIYSIEDLKQLIYDLKNVNPEGRCVGEARLGSRCRHGCRRRRQGHGRSCDDLRFRRRHGRIAAHLASSMPAPRGRSALRKRSRHWCSIVCAAGLRSRWTAACAPAATWSSAPCWARTSSASPPRR